MGTSLNELKTGREKLEIINQVLARISAVAFALDNTRIEEIVGLKEQVKSFYEQVLTLKNLVLEHSNKVQDNADFVEIQKEKIAQIYAKIKENFEHIQTIYNAIIKAQQSIENDVEFVKEKYPELCAFNANFEIIKAKLEEYQTIVFDFNAGLEKVEENTKLSKSYLDLSIELKEQIFKELEHAGEIKEDLHQNVELVNRLVSNIIATKNEIVAISNDFKNVKAQVQSIVNDAEEMIKLKVNTILFENQRLNQNMIELLKRCENLEGEIVGKYEDVLEAVELIKKSQTMIEDLNAAVLAAEQFAADLKTYTQIIKDFQTQMDNLKLEVQNYQASLKAELDLKAEEIKANIEAKLSEIKLLKEEMQTLYDNAKSTVDTALANFIERAKIANEDLGRLLEVARVELANDKTAIESYLLTLKQSIIEAMREVSSEVLDETSGILAQKDAIVKLIEQGKMDLNALITAFTADYETKLNAFDVNYQNKLGDLNQNAQTKLEEFNTNSSTKLDALEALSKLSVQNIEAKRDESITQIENLSAEKLAKFEEVLRENLGGVYAHIFDIEKVLLEKEIVKLSYKE